MKYIEKYQKFMYGRYGYDELYKFLFLILVILFIVDLFINNIFMLIAELLVLIIMFYRFFSKNIKRRKKENKFFLRIKKIVSKPFINIKRNVNDKEHVYVKCRKCKKTLKLPIPMERGFKTVKCPNCKKRIKKLILKKVKVEIITKKSS